MKTNLLLLCLFFCLFACDKGEEQQPAESMGAWLQKNDFPGEARSGAVAFTIGSKAYLGLGNNLETSHFQDIWEYSVTDDTWTRKADFVDYNPAAAISIGSKGYILTSWGQLYEYDPALDVWTRKQAVPGDKRWAVSGFSVGNKIYAAMRVPRMERDGVTPDHLDFWSYSFDSDTWTRIADFPGKARSLPTTFTVGNKAYFGIGMEGDDSSTMLTDIWEYDPQNNSWKQKTEYPGTKQEAVSTFAISSQGNGYMSGPIESETYVGSKIWEYNPLSNSWRKVKNFPSRTSVVATFTIQGKAYVATGYSPSKSTVHSKEVWEFTP